MPKLRSESFGPGDQSWLGSTHGIRNARPGVIDISTFTPATHYPEGFIPSGTPLALVGGMYVPYDKTEATVTNAGVLAGFLLTDQRVVGTQDFPAPVLDHGRVKVAKIPQAGGFTAPAAAAKNKTTFVFV